MRDAAEEICIDESKINPDAICPEVWDPVLGWMKKYIRIHVKQKRMG
ncbi:MAG: hypothetical protein Ct9H90mP15_03130 [Candidatus Neomarinimicrobiota bacterium]|nr:MAG: hypothetical protein Ct9H90mP15_03130 [Candidatus Neomarinimicrobiota bacterium]